MKQYMSSGPSAVSVSALHCNDLVWCTRPEVHIRAPEDLLTSHVTVHGCSQTVLRAHPSIHPFAPSLCFRYTTMSAEYAIVYAALILQDDGIEITADKLSTLVKAAGVEVEPVWFLPLRQGPRWPRP
ncbi:hypothetical protein NQZ79_g8351 [Umbelopsis isabellina]|nr:hypothetical protein NQZ79_g8351 [Umbelopsis isabellina]